MKRLVMAGIVLAILACNTGYEESDKPSLYPSPTSDATQTPAIVQITTTPLATYTPIVLIVTETPPAVSTLCVSATVAVHLRPSPSTENYPIMVLENKTVVEDLGGRQGKWLFVKYGESSGWIHQDYVIACNKTQE